MGGAVSGAVSDGPNSRRPGRGAASTPLPRQLIASGAGPRRPPRMAIVDWRRCPDLQRSSRFCATAFTALGVADGDLRSARSRVLPPGARFQRRRRAAALYRRAAKRIRSGLPPRAESTTIVARETECRAAARCLSQPRTRLRPPTRCAARSRTRRAFLFAIPDR